MPSPSMESETDLRMDWCHDSSVEKVEGLSEGSIRIMYDLYFSGSDSTLLIPIEECKMTHERATSCEQVQELVLLLMVLQAWRATSERYAY